MLESFQSGIPELINPQYSVGLLNLLCSPSGAPRWDNRAGL